jgi:hypothetical protein
MNFEIENGNFSKNPDKADFSIDLFNKDAGLVAGRKATSEGEAARSKVGQLSVEIEAKRPGPKALLKHQRNHLKEKAVLLKMNQDLLVKKQTLQLLFLKKS